MPSTHVKIPSCSSPPKYELATGDRLSNISFGHRTWQFGEALKKRINIINSDIYIIYENPIRKIDKDHLLICRKLHKTKQDKNCPGKSEPIMV